MSEREIVDRDREGNLRRAKELRERERQRVSERVGIDFEREDNVSGRVERD